MKYQIVGSDGVTIVEELISSVKEVSDAFSAIDWQEQLNTEIQVGVSGQIECPAHLFVELGNLESLLLVPSPSGVNGQIISAEQRTKYLIFKEITVVATPFKDIDVKHTHNFIKDFILGNHENILTTIGATP